MLEETCKGDPAAWFVVGYVVGFLTAGLLAMFTHDKLLLMYNTVRAKEKRLAGRGL